MKVIGRRVALLRTEDTMKYTKIALWGAGLALALGTMPLAAQGRGPMMGCGGMMGMDWGQGRECPPPMERFLDLTDAQKTSLKTIHERHDNALDTKTRAAEDARDDLRKAMRDPATTDAKLKDLNAKASDARFAVVLERRAFDREFEAILTPEQKARLKQFPPCGGPRHKGKGPRGWDGLGGF